MDVNKYIKPQSVIARLKADTKEASIRQLVDRLFEVESACMSAEISSDDLYHIIMNRERVQTTGLGNSVAYPHARIEECDDLVVAIGVSPQGIDFGSPDGKPCHFICLMISPVSKPYIILQMMAALSRFFLQPGNLEKIKSRSTARQIVDVLVDSMWVTTQTVLARDIMRPPEKVVSMETSIEEAAHLMHLNKLDALPVVDEDSVLRGEISCLNIFAYSIPDFFSRLQTVSFVRHLDPFEKYFRLKRDLKVKDMYAPSTRAIGEDMTLMEIIFEMTTNNKSRLYVVEEAKLVGVVDRFTVIDRVLFF
jgi:PTS system nitrogen regulatory IIA component